MTSRQTEYLEQLRRLVDDGRSAPLRDVLRARLSGDRTPRHGLASPPLGRDEMGEAAILLVLIDDLKAAPDGLSYLRHELYELLEQEVRAPAFDAAGRERASGLARLLAYAKIADDAVLSERLRDSMWGLLNGRLEKPMEELPEISESARLRATAALDIWLAATPYHHSHRPAGFKEVNDRIAHVFETLLQAFNQNTGKVWKTAEQLRLLYRCVVKFDPKKSGEVYFWRMCALTAPSNSETVQEYLSAHIGKWNALCWEYGKIFKSNTDWGHCFYDGLRKAAASRTGAAAELPDIELAAPYLKYFGAEGRDALNDLQSARGINESPSSATPTVVTLNSFRQKKSA
jgi:hypothetical protein